MLLGTAILRTAQLVGRSYAGRATSGSTTTLLDTNQKSTSEGFFNGGVICIQSGTNANRTRTITAYENADRKFTFDALTGAIAAGVQYTAIRTNYTLDELIAAINLALGDIGPMTQHNDTLLVTADTEEYTLPAGVFNVVRVEVGEDDAAPYSWVRHHYWQEQAGSLIFPAGREPTDTAMPIRVWYNAPHATVSADTDVIAEINPLRLAWASAYYAYFMRSKQVGTDDKELRDLIQAAGAQMNLMAAKYPIRSMQKDARLSIW